MSNRAIRNNQLNFDPMNKDKYEVFQALNTPINNAHDRSVWEVISDAQRYDVEIGGMKAHEYRSKVQTLTNAVSFDGLHNTLTHLLNVMLMELIDKAMTPNRRAIILDGITRMRNQLVNNPDLRWGYGDNHPNFNQAFADQQQDTFDLLKEVADEVVSKFNGKNTYSLVQTRWYHNMFHAATDDAQLEMMANNPCTYFFNINSAYLIPYVSFQSYNNSTQIVELESMLNLTDDEMEDMVLTLKEKHPRLHLEIASIHEFALANPQVASLAQSWTSRYSHSWCFFKQHYTDISKKNTLSCGLISDLFGKHTPTFAGLKGDWEQKMVEIIDDMKKAEPAMEKAKKIEEENQNKTAENIEKAIKAKLNEMLSNGNDDEQSDALTLIGNLAGIQGHHLSQTHTTTYYSHAHGQDQILYLHWNALLSYEVSMDNIILTDAQQGIIASRYQERRQEMIDAHARTCAQLARQIAHQTINHDEQMKTNHAAFVSYQASV
jgi:hypothetical protein